MSFNNNQTSSDSSPEWLEEAQAPVLLEGKTSGMTVSIQRKKGEAVVLRVLGEDGTSRDIVIYVRRLTSSRVGLYFKDCTQKGKEIPNTTIKINRLEHFQEEEFERFLEVVEDEDHKELNRYNMCRYYAIPYVGNHSVIVSASEDEFEGQE